MQDPKPIFVGEIHLLPWRDVKEKVYLNHKGEIFSDSLRIPDDRQRNFRRWYGFIKDYLDKKRLRYSIVKFFKTDLSDIREMMWHKNQKTISRNRIEDIVHSRNQIAFMKDTIKSDSKNMCLKSMIKN